MSRLETCACVLLLAAAVGLQIRVGAGALGTEFASPDPPAQFTTGVMAHDYLRYAFGSNPIAFAESFYVRFPKVALGQWPPAYFALQALWYLIFPISVSSARFLSVAFTLSISSVLFLRLRRSCGVLAACAGAAVFLSLPLIQGSAWAVMSDLLTGVFVFFAVLSFSSFLREPRRSRDAWNFALWSSLALLTKGTAVALVFFAVLAPLFAWRLRCFRAARYWAAGIACAIVSAPFYIFVAHAGFAYSLKPPARGPDPNFSRLSYVTTLWHGAPALVWILASVGLAAALLHRWRSPDNDPATNDALVAAAYVASMVVFLMAFPLTLETRAFIPVLAPAAILVGYCVSRIQWVLRSRPVVSTAIPAALASLCIATAGAVPLSHTGGFQAALDAIPYRPEGCLMLVSGSAPAEGDMVVARLVHDPWHSGIVLRASRVLAENSWSGMHYRPRFPDADAVAKYLMDLPVRYILLDDSERLPYGALLDQAIRADPRNFALLGRFPIHSYGRLLGEVAVYENRAAGDRRPAVVRVPLDLERGSRVMEYRWR
jgi:hypothetical protein